MVTRNKCRAYVDTEENGSIIFKCSAGDMKYGEDGCGFKIGNCDRCPFLRDRYCYNIQAQAYTLLDLRNRIKISAGEIYEQASKNGNKHVKDMMIGMK